MCNNSPLAALYQEYIELDLFNYGLKRFSDAEFEEAGVTADYRSIIQYMANQETGHAQLVTNVSLFPTSKLLRCRSGHVLIDMSLPISCRCSDPELP